MAEHVPTNGFNAPPSPGAPAVPQPGNSQGLPPGVPPAGPAPRMPNGTPYSQPGMQPGWVQNPVQPQGEAVGQQQAPQQQAAPQGQPDLSGVMELLQRALATTQPGQPAQAAQEVPSKPNAQAAESLNNFNANELQDPVLRAMAVTMQTVGKDLDLDRVLGRAISSGDVSLIDTAYLRDAAGEHAPQLTEIAKGIVQSIADKAARVTNDIFASVGGEAQWQAVAAVFNKSAPRELRVTVAQMFDSQNTELIRAASKIVAEFGRSSGQLPKLGAPQLTTASAGIQGQALSKADFKAALFALDHNSPNFTADRESLMARRSLGRRIGL